MSKNKLQQAEKELEEIIHGAEEKVEEVVHDVVEKIKKPFHKKPHFWIIAVFVIVLIVIGLIYSTVWVPIKNSISLARQTQEQFEKVQNDLLIADFDSAKNNIQDAQKMLEKLEKNVNKIDSPLMLGYLKRQYGAVEGIILATQEFSDGLYLLTELAQDVLDNIETQDGNLTITQQQRKIILDKFSKKTPELNGAKAQIDLSLLALNNINIGELNSVLANYVISVRTKLGLLRGFLDKSVDLSQTLPSLLGLEEEKTYLFLLQNYNELRPTGGFIGTVGIVKIKNGEITSFRTNNIYDYDKYAHKFLKINPPAPIQKYLNVDGWYMRDSNWSPDFVESAKQIEYFFHKEVGLSRGNLRDYKIDGVIAITPKIIEDFLAIAGAIEVDSFVFNKDNFVDRLQYLVEVGYKDQNVEYFQRKNIIGTLAEKLIDRTENLNISGWVDLVKSLFENLNSKHILVYSKDPAVQNLVDAQNWSNKFHPTRDDFLSVIDANLAALKSNSCVTRDIKYITASVEGEMKSKVDITYKNNCTFTWKSTRYRTYTRAYVPLGSVLTKTEGAMEIDRSNKTGQTDVTEELGRTVFGAFISIEPGEEGTLSFEYKLPKSFSDYLYEGGEYRLTVQKQPGTSEENLLLNLNFANEIHSTFPAEPRQYWGDKQYKLSTDLEIDREVKIGF